MEDKIQYEECVDRRLKPDLMRACTEFTSPDSDCTLRGTSSLNNKVFSLIREKTENLEKNSITSLKTEVPDTQCIFVNVGLGFHEEFTWSEALRFLTLREEKIVREIEEYTRLVASIKALIKLVCEEFENCFRFQLRNPCRSRYCEIRGKENSCSGKLTGIRRKWFQLHKRTQSQISPNIAHLEDLAACSLIMFERQFRIF